MNDPKTGKPQITDGYKTEGPIVVELIGDSDPFIPGRSVPNERLLDLDSAILTAIDSFCDRGPSAGVLEEMQRLLKVQTYLLSCLVASCAKAGVLDIRMVSRMLGEVTDGRWSIKLAPKTGDTHEDL